MISCHTCNGRGLPGDGCPECGAKVNQTIDLRSTSFVINTDIIPSFYQGKTWEKPSYDGTETDLVKEIDDRVAAVQDKFLSGEKPSFSLFISCNEDYGKFIFAYSCMQAALLSGYTVAPLLSTADWKRIHKQSQINPGLKLYGNLRWDELVRRDVVFIYVDHSDDRLSDIWLLKTVLDSRATMGLGTYIISDYHLPTLSSRYNSKEYKALLSSAQKKDLNRFPIIIQRP